MDFTAMCRIAERQEYEKEEQRSRFRVGSIRQGDITSVDIRFQHPRRRKVNVESASPNVEVCNYRRGRAQDLCRG